MHAFSLVEMLVAIVILVVIVVLAGGVIGSVSETARQAQGRMSNFDKARALINRLSMDLNAGIFDGTLPAFPDAASGARFAFFVGRPAAGSRRSLSCSEYFQDRTENPGAFYRRDLAFPWEGGSVPLPWGAAAPDMSSATDSLLCEGIAGFAYAFLQQDGTFSRTYIAADGTRSVAIRLALAVLDERAVTRLAASEKLGPLLAGLAGAVSDPDQKAGPAWSARGDWERFLATQAGNLPSGVTSGTRIFEVTLALPGGEHS